MTNCGHDQPRLTYKAVTDSLSAASEAEREIFFRMRRMGYSSQEAYVVAIHRSRIGKGDFKDLSEVREWLDDVETAVILELYSELMIPGFPCHAPSTYHPLQEDRHDPNYYWN